MFKLTLLILAIKLLVNQAAVIRILNNETDVVENTTIAIDILTSTLKEEQTTLMDEDLAIRTTEGLEAKSRDEEATVLIADQTLLDSASAELIKTEDQAVNLNKPAKLLLLSTPKIAEKPKQPEESLEESEEENEVFESGSQITTETIPTTTTDEETSTNLNDTADVTLATHSDMESQSFPALEKITKLYPINDTLYADDSKTVECASGDISATATLEDRSRETLNANLRSVVLQEFEPDYILVESEVEGSYTDVDSELHLQPIVQSVEIVPSSLDDTLFINYVHSL